MTSILTKQQYKSFGPKPISGYDKGAALWAHVRFDDECNNGHNTFSITGSVREPGHRDISAGGCLHDDIARVYPELAKYIKWHLCSTDGSMYYIANTLYLAGDKDHYGRRAGEPSSHSTFVRFGDSPVSHKVGGKFFLFLKERYGTGDFSVVGITHTEKPETYGTHYTLEGFGEKWHDCPFKSKVEANEFCQAMNRCKVEFVVLPTEFSNGKARELDAARNAAIWPEATDEELMADNLKEVLEARLPGLLVEFKAAMEELGFVW